MDFHHKSGILLHVTSLPGRFGIGDIGPDAYEWLDFLNASRVHWWQVLPLGPTGYGDSPYQAYSSFAANPLLISPALLAEEGLIDSEHLEVITGLPEDRVDFAKVIDWKRGLFQVAFMRLKSAPKLQKEFEEFCQQQATWLDDFSLFMALKLQNDLRAWITWPAPLRDREPKVIAEARREYAATIAFFSFQQFLFHRQWSLLRAEMKKRGVKLIGDLPIYVAHDSSDAWCNRHLFEMDENGNPLRVAGVPPDMFAATGQLWGNPLYRWGMQKEHGYDWWMARLRAVLGMVDVIRLDHFRGFADYYAVPASQSTAEHGTWELGPGADFFNAVERGLGKLPLIAEDLGGERTPIVIELRDQFNLPGMKIVQFGFDEDMNHRFLPHNYPQECVAYTGTHDNDTTEGWFQHATEHERKFCLDYLKSDGKRVAWDMLRSLWASKATLTLAPLQDFLELGSEARMNLPGTALGNWNWRARRSDLTPELADRIAKLNTKFDRA